MRLENQLAAHHEQTFTEKELTKDNQQLMPYTPIEVNRLDRWHNKNSDHHEA